MSSTAKAVQGMPFSRIQAWKAANSGMWPPGSIDSSTPSGSAGETTVR